MPWYGDVERALRPLDPYMSFILVGLATITLLVAWKGDAVVKSAWLVYLISP